MSANRNLTITHASDGTPGLERSHPDEDAPTDEGVCHDCGRPWDFHFDGLLLCFECAGDRAGDRRRDVLNDREENL